MRKPDAATTAVPTDRRGDPPVEMVCVALMLALVALISRIWAVW